MKRIILLCITVLLFVPALSQAGIIGPANIRYVDGDVMFRTPDDDEWLPASINTPLDEGDAVWCSEDSRVEIQLPDGSMLRLDGGSQLDLIANEDGFTHIHLANGRLYLRTAQSLGKNALQIDADDTTVVPAARTRLRIDMLPNSQEDVAIFKGTAYVEGNGSRTKVRAGEHIALEEGHSELLPLNPADNWEYWNVERDRMQSRSARLESNLPDELRSHAAELDSNGTWVRVPDYGMVWRPTVIVSGDWAPYRTGRWIWKGGDYVWISDESWGWVPYHYGRWAVVSGFGWCWVPPSRGDVYWGPGFVGWYNTGTHVGWTPLAPGEVFYGRRYYGRHSAISTSVTINPVTVVYRNRSNPGGFTVVQHSDFQRGRTIIQQPARTPALSVSVSIGAPRITPLRETRMPVIRQTPPRVAPPRIEHRDRHDMRERFPRITPESAPDRRRQQTPAVTVPAAPARQPEQPREKRMVYPVSGSGDNNKVTAPKQPEILRGRDEYKPRPAAPTQPAPATTGTAPQKPEQPRREENRQRTEPPKSSPQPTPTVPTAPAVVPQRPEQPRREYTPAVTVPAPQPQQDRSKRDEQRQRPSAQQPVPPSAPAVPQRVEQPKPQPAPPAAPREAVRQRGERAPAEIKEKKVWKVTTPDNQGDKENRDRGHKER